MSTNKNILVDHLDETLQGRSLPEAEVLLAQDSNAREEWQYLQLAVEAIQHEGLFNQVRAIRESSQQQTPVVSMKRSVVRTLFRNSMRVAASLLFLVLAVATYKYITTSTGDLYTENYTAFNLSVSRGSEAGNQIEQAYRNKDWQGVINTFSQADSFNNKSLFLIGIAYMEIKQYGNAIQQFNSILDHNLQTGDDYFNDDAEYYLALSYLANKQAPEAVSLIQKIKADKAHLYNQKAAEISSVELSIIEYKSK